MKLAVLMLHEHVAPALTSLPHAHLARHVPASAINLEQQFENRLQLHPVKEEKTSLATLERRLVEAASSAMEEEDTDSEQNKHAAQVQLHHWLPPSYLAPSYHLKEKNHQSLDTVSLPSKGEEIMNFKRHKVVAFARKPLLASREATLLAEDSKVLGTNFDDSTFPNLTDDKLKEKKIVRSTRLMERQSRKRRGPKLNHQVQEKKRTERFRKILTMKEESKLIANIQSFMKLQEVERRLQTRFAREPTLSEWAEAAGLTSRELKSQLHSANISREKLVNANLRMVVHIAKQYRGNVKGGLSLPDLLQAGSMGLVKSVEKFKPQAGCRFSTYSYLWIRRSVWVEIIRNSRVIHLPAPVHALLSKIRKARDSYFQQGNHYPTEEDIAHSVGITVEKLLFLLKVSRRPISLTKSMLESIPDEIIEDPWVSLEKEMMRRGLNDLLSVLSPRERKIIALRFGMGGGAPCSLAEIGVDFGVTRERIRQLEKRALDKLRENLSSYGLDGLSKEVLYGVDAYSNELLYWLDSFYKDEDEDSFYKDEDEDSFYKDEDSFYKDEDSFYKMLLRV